MVKVVLIIFKLIQVLFTHSIIGVELYFDTLHLSKTFCFIDPTLLNSSHDFWVVTKDVRPFFSGCNVLSY